MNPSMNRATVFLTDLRCDGGFRALSITSGVFWGYSRVVAPCADSEVRIVSAAVPLGC